MSGLTTFLMHEVEMPLVPVVADMEDAGYPVKVQFFHDLRARLEPERLAVQKRIRKYAGKNINPSSPSQLVNLLYEKLKLEVLKETKTGKPSTDNETLKRLASEHRVVPEIIRFRDLEETIST
jgi:DNA polymerase-1